MQNRDRKLQLIWNVNKFRCHTNDVEIAIAPNQFPPFPVNAIVEEQDTALILGETNEIRNPGDKPAWYLANTLESQPLLTPGQVIIRDTRPLRLQAIIHDLEEDPSCNELWIFQIIQQIFDIADTRAIHAIQMPLLGTRFNSNIKTGQFFNILLEIINRQRPAPINKLWLVTDEEKCELFYNELLETIEQHNS